jgi:hypothetical protein
MINWRKVAEITHECAKLSRENGVELLEVLKCAVEQDDKVGG